MSVLWGRLTYNSIFAEQKDHYFAWGDAKQDPSQSARKWQKQAR